MNLRKLIKQNGIKRIGPEAMKEIESHILDQIKQLSSQSAMFADHSGKKTVSIEDVKLALLVSK
jgi:histone H3/H4